MGEAWISPCGTYRYTLDRTFGPGPLLAWLMLNPSTADASKDDPTIRKVIGFSKRWGAGSIRVVNLFAWRATKPRDCLANLADAEGPDNFKAVTGAAQAAEYVVCAWGAQTWAREQAKNVKGWLMHAGARPLCIGLTKDGDPLHPLMQPYAKGLTAYEWDRKGNDR